MEASVRYFWVKYLSKVIFLGPAKTVDTILIFLGIKVRNTDIFGFFREISISESNVLFIDLLFM